MRTFHVRGSEVRVPVTLTSQKMGRVGEKLLLRFFFFFLRHLTLNSNLLCSLGRPQLMTTLASASLLTTLASASVCWDYRCALLSQPGCCVSCQNLSSGEATLYVKFLSSLSFGNRYLPPLLGKQTPCEISLSFMILGLCLNGLVWVCSKSCLR